MKELKYVPIQRPDPVRFPKVQLFYESEFLENYKKTIKVLKANIVQILNS